MSRTARWLAAAAMLALAAGTAGAGEAATRARAHTTTHAKHAHRGVVRRTARRVAVRAAAGKHVAAVVEAVPAPVPPPDPKLAAVPDHQPGPRPGYAPYGEPARAADPDYRWLDDADAMMGAVDGTEPDLRFVDAGVPRYAWRLSDGAVVIAAPISSADTRFFFFAPDTAVPFLVRDRQYSYAFDHGVVAAVFGADGQLLDGQPGGRAAGALYAEGRRLWYAASRPQQAQLWGGPSWSINFHGSFGSWRDNDGWRRWRQDRNGGRGPDPHDRYRGDRDARRANSGHYGRTPQDGWGTSAPQDGQFHGGASNRSGQRRPGPDRSTRNDGAPPRLERAGDAATTPAGPGYGGRRSTEAAEPPVGGDMPAAAYTPPADTRGAAPERNERRSERPAYTSAPQPVAEAPADRSPAPAAEPVYRAPERPAPAAPEPQQVTREPERAAPPQPAPEPPAPAPTPPRQPTPADQKRAAGSPDGNEPPAD
ncbi:hypothetical protein [Sphingomonas sp.]|uniref:hypothetical protein n=1 Tax=Sphingomonas sp. TaxID=28214 RepID=UPI003CC58761